MRKGVTAGAVNVHGEKKKSNDNAGSKHRAGGELRGKRVVKKADIHTEQYTTKST